MRPLIVKTKVIDVTEDLFAEKIPDISGGASREIKGENIIADCIREGKIFPDERFNLRTEAWLLQLAHTNNKILSLSNSRTRILAHQVESTHKIVNALNQRFLIADEVGLGKTIEAGLVIKELIFRYAFSRILIVCPASLMIQWQNEMEEKFGERFEVIERKTLMKRRREIGDSINVWDSFEKVICSIDFAKSDSVLSGLEASRWDAIIIDEAHRLRRDANITTRAYNVGEILSTRTKAFLLLTATPFRGKLEELYYLVRLVDKNLLGPFQSFQHDFCSPDSDVSRLKDKLSKVVIRRTKKEVGGFVSRHARTIRFELHPEEMALYEATTRYVAEEFNRAMQTENRAVGFVMTVFQKLIDSSSYALLSALRNRRTNLSAQLDKADLKARTFMNDEMDLEELDPEYFDIENFDEMMSTTLQKTADEIREEILTIENLIRIAENIERNKKGEKLIEMIASLSKAGKKKFLIFTQFRTTQDYLEKLLSGYRLAIFNGSMDKDAKEQAILDFKNDAQILICTEAGGEGRNMQFCSVLFNYDLPWSPLKIEQRIGRIHRFGQLDDVSIYNFSTKDTVAERVLDVLTHKLQLFENSIGTPDIMLGQIEDELKLTTLFMDMSTGRRNVKSAEAEIDLSIARARASYEKISELTVSRRMDFNYDEYYRITQKDRLFSNKQLETFIDSVRRQSSDVTACIGDKETKTKLWPIRMVPGAEKHHPYGTFDSETALASSSLEFLAFGHPLVDYTIRLCRSESFGGLTGFFEIDHDRPFAGMVFFYVARYRSLTETREIIPAAVDFDQKAFSFELVRIERECSRRIGSIPSVKNMEEHAQRASQMADDLVKRANDRVREKIEQKLWDIREHLDLTIDPEMEKIKEACDLQIREYAAQLERQEMQANCFGKDMRSAITRTKNRIIEAEKERDIMLALYRRRLGVQCSLECVSAGILIAKSPQ
jgi:superfamily II DNA or RNA helicase